MEYMLYFFDVEDQIIMQVMLSPAKLMEMLYIFFYCWIVVLEFHTLESYPFKSSLCNVFLIQWSSMEFCFFTVEQWARLIANFLRFHCLQIFDFDDLSVFAPEITEDLISCKFSLSLILTKLCRSLIKEWFLGHSC